MLEMNDLLNILCKCVPGCLKGALNENVLSAFLRHFRIQSTNFSHFRKLFFVVSCEVTKVKATKKTPKISSPGIDYI